MAPAHAVHPVAPPQSVLERLQTLISENRRTVLVCSAVAALALGTALYVASSSPRAGADKGRPRDAKKKDKDKGGAARKRKTGGDGDGPVLEEIKPGADEDEAPLSAEEIAGMSAEERTKRADALKQRGNAHYSARKFVRAAELYTQAIRVSSKPNPVFLSNRAACFMNMKPPQYERVVEDCNGALSHNSEYVKALNRRANALEALSRHAEALRDFVAAMTLEMLTNPSTTHSVERVLKMLVQQRAETILVERTPKLPSRTFLSAYFSAFRKREHPILPETPLQGDQTLLLALEALDAADYPHAFSLVNEAVDQGVSWDVGHAEALNLRGTFKFITSDVPGAKKDLEESILLNPSLTQSLVKLASVYMEQGDREQALESFERAIRVNPQDPDVYYHRGQVNFILGEYSAALEDYTKSSELDGTFVFSHIQLAVAQYKMNKIEESKATFRRAMAAFPERAEVCNYYAEVLMDQTHFDDAVEMLDKAIELANAESQPNPLPFVNKALALFQWRKDVEGAKALCNEALTKDASCDQAVGMLAQLALYQSEFEEAVKLFERQVELARTKEELEGALSSLEMGKTHIEFVKNYPAKAEQLRQLAASTGV